LPVIGSAIGFAFPSARGQAWLGLGTGPELAPPLQINSPAAICNVPGLVYTLPFVVLRAPGNPTSVTIPIPNDPLLAGLPLVVQGFALQQAGCLLLTEALGVVVQLP